MSAAGFYDYVLFPSRYSMAFPRSAQFLLHDIERTIRAFWFADSRRFWYWNAMKNGYVNRDASFARALSGLPYLDQWVSRHKTTIDNLSSRPSRVEGEQMAIFWVHLCNSISRNWSSSHQSSAEKYQGPVLTGQRGQVVFHGKKCDQLQRSIHASAWVRIHNRIIYLHISANRFSLFLCIFSFNLSSPRNGGYISRLTGVTSLAISCPIGMRLDPIRPRSRRLSLRYSRISGKDNSRSERQQGKRRCQRAGLENCWQSDIK
jgi:hypothetical protein